MEKEFVSTDEAISAKKATGFVDNLYVRTYFVHQERAFVLFVMLPFSPKNVFGKEGERLL